jgi:hypothetical protein
LSLTTFARPALRPATAQDQVQVLAIWYGLSNWILRNNTAIVFDVYIQVSAWNHAISKSQDFHEAIRAQPVIDIITDVRLQNDLLLFSDYSATIDEVSNEMADFSNVSVRRNVIAIRQNKSWKQCGIRVERIL